MVAIECGLLVLLLVLPRPAQPQGDVGLGMECEVSADCRKPAYCSGAKVCTCRETYVPDRDNNTCLAGLREKCRYDDGCVRNAYCRLQERCECKEGYVPTLDLLHCKNCSSIATRIPSFLLLTILYQVLLGR